MVYLTRILGYVTKLSRPKRKLLQSGFIDKVELRVKAGTGGSGLFKYGGIGGRGGDVYVRAKEGTLMKDIAKYVKGRTIVAGTGYDSSQRGILGENGEDVIINVPPGVIVYHENGTVIGQVNEPDKRLAVALGGVGGCKETDYSGQKGEEHGIVLNLKILSDVAVIGLPNAGKSTLVRTISTAKPKIAKYAFSTVKPHVGKIIYHDFREITIVDLPGLIEGAHKNVGLGHNFLKHAERSKMLLFIVDIGGFRLSARQKWKNCLKSVLILNKEIELCKPELLDLPAMLVLNKMDTDAATTFYEEFKPKLENLKDYKSEFPKTMCPTKILEFKNILPMALINKNKDEINNLKTLIRHNIDRIYEIEQRKLNDEVLERKLVEKLKKQMRLNAPTLV